MEKLNSKIAVALLLFFLLPFASAQFDGGDISDEDQETFDQILEPVLKIYNLVKYIATFIAALFLLFAGVTYIMSGSDPKKRDGAKSMIMYVAIGLIVIWAAPLFVNFIVS